VTRHHELALAEATRALDEQRSTIDTLQGRAGVLLAFAAVANLLVGQRAFDNELADLSQVAASVGIISAVGAASFLLSICWGSSYHFHLEPSALARRQGVWSMVDENLLDGFAALAMASHISANNEGLRDLYSRLRWSLVLLVTNLTAWGFVILLEEVK
jgi:hypothetical protein